MPQLKGVKLDEEIKALIKVLRKITIKHLHPV